MTTHFECVVVGAGVEGSSTAYQLAKAGKNTLLLEQFPIPHSRGSSHGASRITRKVYARNKTYTQMMLEAYGLWEKLEKESGVQLYRKTGVLWLGRKTEGEVQENARVMTEYGLEHKMLTDDELREKYPQLKHGKDWIGLFDPEGGILYADKCVNAFRTEFVGLGGTLHDSEPLKSLIPGRPVKLRTTKSTYTCDSVVLCLGAWAATFLPQIGMNLPLQPQTVKACYWNSKVPGQYSADNGFPCFITDDSIDGLFYGLPADEYPDMFKFCWFSGTNILSPEERDKLTGAQVQSQIDRCKSYINRYMDNLSEQPAIVETCIFTNTPDLDFILDKHPVHDNIIVGAGFSGHGFKLAPVVGKVLAALATKHSIDYNISGFRANRFDHKSKL